MEKEENTCLARLPTRKAVLVMLIVFAAAITLIFVHLSGQWVGQRVFKQVYVTGKPAKSRMRLVSTLTHGQSPQRTGTSWQTSEDVQKRNDDVLLDEQSTSLTSILTTGSSPRSLPKPSLFRKEQNQTKSVLSLGKTAGLSQDTVPGLHTVGVSSATTERVLQGIIREAMNKTMREGPTKKKALSVRTMFNWNDRDPKSYTNLPLRGRHDGEWKREETLIFNRVGKCGSRSVITLLRQLSAMNNFNLVSSIVYNMTSIRTDWQRRIAQVLDRVQTPYLFQRHLHFVNFKDFNLRQPMYINIIRDPLARFVSNYYFKRFGDGRSNQNFKGTKEDKYRSVTTCIMEGHRECVQRGLMYIIPFFCGQQSLCKKPTQWALDRAKQNVEKHFVAVGILEDLENTYRVFEKVAPRFFQGVVKLFLEPDKQQLEKNSSTLTKFKEKPSPEAAAIMKSLMKYEYDFYYFVRDRLEGLKEKYGIGQER